MFWTSGFIFWEQSFGLGLHLPPMPDTGGGGKAITNASGISARTRPFIFARIAGRLSSCVFRSENSLNGRNTAGRVRLIAAEEIESREFDGVENARGFVRDFRNLVDNRLGPLERSSIR